MRGGGGEEGGRVLWDASHGLCGRVGPPRTNVRVAGALEPRCVYPWAHRLGIEPKTTGWDAHALSHQPRVGCARAVPPTHQGIWRPPGADVWHVCCKDKIFQTPY